MTLESKSPLLTAMLIALYNRGGSEENLYTIGKYLGMTDNETKKWIKSFKGNPIPEIPKEKLDEIRRFIVADSKKQYSTCEKFSYMMQFCINLGLDRQEAEKTVLNAVEILNYLRRKRITNIYIR